MTVLCQVSGALVNHALLLQEALRTLTAQFSPARLPVSSVLSLNAGGLRSPLLNFWLASASLLVFCLGWWLPSFHLSWTSATDSHSHPTAWPALWMSGHLRQLSLPEASPPGLSLHT